MSPAEERAYVEGERAAHVAMLKTCLSHLDVGHTDGLDKGKARWLLEREAMIAQLRIACRALGVPADFEPQEFLPDVLEKRVMRKVNEMIVKLDQHAAT